MAPLSPTGARILAAHVGGAVSGHDAAMARLEAHRLVEPHPSAHGTHRMTKDGWEALEEWRLQHAEASAPASAPGILPKLPGRQHEAVLTAARRPDQLVAGRDDEAYRRGEPWFLGTTLRAVHRAGYAGIRPQPWDDGPVTWEDTRRSLYLTPAGREYARQRGGIDVRRRRVVIIACGSEKRPDPGPTEYGTLGAGCPAGELYTGQYHRSLRLAADSLTDQSLIRVLSALHGLVELTRRLRPYDVTIGHERAVTADKLAGHTAALGLNDADVIFLGGQEYAKLLAPSVPHLLTPLTGGMGGHRGLCRQASEDAALRNAWWKQASHLHALRHPAP
ncbi:DUF6884 domain-containing protein [Streptomyces sp. HK10]|uniref:DUF6884 domain-containing protein n=1 Tax=Streptomyces sp. HK10 TaxID=3373255 RepID=UPI003749EDD0